MRKLFLLLFITISFVSNAKNKVDYKTNQVSLEITGNTVVEEGSTETYIVRYTSNVGNVSFSPRQIVRGIEQSFTVLQPGSSYQLVVVWDCKAIAAGRIIINASDVSGQAQATLNVAINSYANPGPIGFCTTISNDAQDLIYGEIPNPLGVTCTRFCTNDYQFQYQWQKKTGGSLTNPIYTNIIGATSDLYYPPTFFVVNTSQYRRETKFYISGTLNTIYSNVARVSFYEPLNAGNISTSNIFLYANTAPVIVASNPTGGACPNTGYTYTWETLDLSDQLWHEVGYDQNFPTGILFAVNTTVRRKVQCGNQTLYSNLLSFRIRDPFLAGSIATNQTTNLPFGTLPIITQIPASGGLCDPSNYTYTWERQLLEGVWDNIGVGDNYPANMPIVGTMKIRRKVTCNNEVLYTNVLSITMAPYISPNTENLNYVRINDIVIPGIHTWPEADNLPTGSKLQTTDYLDAFGRSIQQVVKQGSLNADDPNSDVTKVSSYKDLVSITDYDGLGRTAKAFLPFSTASAIGFYKTNAYADQESYNNLLYNEPIGSHFTFSNTSYDESPLQRVTAVKSAGAAYQVTANNGITSDYDFNSINEDIRIWEIDFATGSIPYSNYPYESNTLVKNITKDQKGKLVFEYKDLAGKLILKKVQEMDGAGFDINGYSGWLSTYYVYDDFGRLRYTITPKAVANMITVSSWVLDPTWINGLCFYQEYDKRGRIIKKHSADGGEVWMVYDSRDRLVLTQDENQRNRVNLNPSKPNQWSFSLYDEHDRSVATGLINDSRNQADLQLLADNVSINAQNKNVGLYTSGNLEIIEAFMPIAGKDVSLGGYFCNTCTSVFANSITYYDKYDANALPFATNSVNSFAPTNNQYLESFAKTDRVNGIAVSTKIRVLGDKYDNLDETDDKFLLSTTYFDERTRVIQSLNENVFGGRDLESIQYDYPGKILSTRSFHLLSTSEFDKFTIITKNDYDILQRNVKLSKVYLKGNLISPPENAYKILNEIRHDELGRVKTKKIGADPVNTNTPIETLDYSYNIVGGLTGVNKEYALAGGEGGSSQFFDQFTRRFGYYLGYENADNKFNNAQYNGNITGVIWRSQGDNKPRKYNYEYDNVNRFIRADFTQKENPNQAPSSWSTAKVDLSVNVGGYDANGNILSMIQKGVVPGIQGGIVLDDLHYEYENNGYISIGSRLKAVIDLADATYSGKQGDFKDYAPSNGKDYDYDFNGNLKYDKNKDIISANSNVSDPDPEAGIISNFLDLPESITISKKRTEYIYDAAGNKLAKKLVSLAIPPLDTKTTYFIGAFVYETTTPGNPSTGPESAPSLQYILHEEGKLRIIEPVNAWSPQSGLVNHLENTGNIELINNGNTHKWGVWDYYLKDNLSNTRMVLTEEKHIQQVHCSMESTPAIREQEENETFGANELNFTRTLPTNPSTSWPSNPSQVARLLYVPTLGAEKGGVGPNVIFKVMAGDQINATAKYYYRQTTPSNNNTGGIIPNIITSLLSAISGPGAVSSAVKDNITSSYLSNSNTLNLFSTTNQPQPIGTTSPKAYINYIFFDEQFNYVADNSYAKMVDPVTGNSNFIESFFPPVSKTATKNGYVYVYLSNDSRNIPVYFDDFDVTHIRGAIVEDNAYYPYGLKIQGISAKAALKPQAKEGYQGDYTEHDEESGYDEFELRSYDAQIGRWIQVDPKNEFASGYIGIGANPINSVDKDGGGISVGEISSIVGAIGGAIGAHFIIKNNPQLSGFVKGLISYGLPLLGAGIGYSIGESLDIRFGGKGSSARTYDNDGGGPYKGNGYNQSANLWDNFKQYYVGLSGFTSHQNKVHLNRYNTSEGAATPDIDLLGWRDNNLPDWDFWRIEKQRSNPNFHLSELGLFWRVMSTSKIPALWAPELGGGKLITEIIRKVPVAPWYLYWLIHKPKKKGLSPFTWKARIESIISVPNRTLMGLFWQYYVF